MSFFENARKPVGFGGKIMVAMSQSLRPSISAGLVDCFREVYRVTKPGGTFFVCNESNGETNKDDKWVEKIGGMTIYNAAQILISLNQAGFRDANVSKNDKGWICVTARKV